MPDPEIITLDDDDEVRPLIKREPQTPQENTPPVVSTVPSQTNTVSVPRKGLLVKKEPDCSNNKRVVVLDEREAPPAKVDPHTFPFVNSDEDVEAVDMICTNYREFLTVSSSNGFELNIVPHPGTKVEIKLTRTTANASYRKVVQELDALIKTKKEEVIVREDNRWLQVTQVLTKVNEQLGQLFEKSNSSPPDPLPTAFVLEHNQHVELPVQRPPAPLPSARPVLLPQQQQHQQSLHLQPQQPPLQFQHQQQHQQLHQQPLQQQQYQHHYFQQPHNTQQHQIHQQQRQQHLQQKLPNHYQPPPPQQQQQHNHYHQHQQPPPQPPPQQQYQQQPPPQQHNHYHHHQLPTPVPPPPQLQHHHQLPAPVLPPPTPVTTDRHPPTSSLLSPSARERFLCSKDLTCFITNRELMKQLAIQLSNKVRNTKANPFYQCQQQDKMKIIDNYLIFLQSGQHIDYNVDCKIYEQFKKQWIEYLFKIPPELLKAKCYDYRRRFQLEGNVAGTIHFLPYSDGSSKQIYLCMAIVDQKIVAWITNSDKETALCDLCKSLYDICQKIQWDRNYRFATDVTFSARYKDTLVKSLQRKIYEDNERVVIWMKNNVKCLSTRLYSGHEFALPAIYNMAIKSLDK